MLVLLQNKDTLVLLQTNTVSIIDTLVLLQNKKTR